MNMTESVRQWWAARPKRAPKESPPPGAPSLVWPLFFSTVGLFALLGSLAMLIVFVLGSVGHFDWFTDYSASAAAGVAWDWSFALSVHWPVAIGLFLLCFAIALFNCVWFEAQRTMSGAARWIAVVLGVCVSLFMVSGAIVVQQKGTDAKSRDQIVVAQSAQVGAAAVALQIEDLRREIDALQAVTDDTPSIQALAARAGPEAWQIRIREAEAQNSPQLPVIRRALADAEAAKQLQNKLAELRTQQAAAQVNAVQKAVVAPPQTFSSELSRVIEDLRKPITAVLGELLAVFALGWALAAWERYKQARFVHALGGRNEEDLPLGIPDFRGQQAGAAQSMDAPVTVAREEVVDAETGEVMIKVQPAKAHWRKKPKGRKIAVQENETTAAEDEKQAAVLSATDDRVARDTSADVVLADGAGVLVPDEQSAAVAVLNDAQVIGVADEHQAAVLAAVQAGADVRAVLEQLGYRVDDQRSQVAAE